MEENSQPEKYKRIFARRLAEECEGRQWPEDQWQKRLKEITGASQATISRWLNGESIPQPLARQALSKQFDKLDSYWLGGKTEQEIQTDTEGGAMQLQERPYEYSHRGPAAGGQGHADYALYAVPRLKSMLKDLADLLIDTPGARAVQVLEEIEKLVTTLRSKLREPPEPRREKEAARPQA